ncbi:MAG TPA: hypothetical protein VJ991_04390 [Balneolales bacterium]|nr:hypothetical protein [Balneolales bacterium]
MKKILLSFILIIGLIGCKSSSYSTSNSKQPCKVLMKELQGTYTGGCKKGLANGNGKAIGTDTYQGHFKKGYPDGKGTYTWASGAQYKGKWEKGKQNGLGSFTITKNDSSRVKKGYWVDGKYAGKNKPKPPYQIETKRSISNVRFRKLSDKGNNISLRFTQNGTDVKKFVKNLLLNGNSGTSNTSLTNNIGFDKVDFPFEGIISYTISNSFSMSKLQPLPLKKSGNDNNSVSSDSKPNSSDCQLKFVINKPGNWEIIIANN